MNLVIREQVFCTHTCKNSLLEHTHPRFCNRAFVDRDKQEAQRPPVGKYCPECIRLGFTNGSRKYLNVQMLNSHHVQLTVL